MCSIVYNRIKPVLPEDCEMKSKSEAKCEEGEYNEVCGGRGLRDVKGRV